eukprot:s56_g21.t1
MLEKTIQWISFWRASNWLFQKNKEITQSDGLARGQFEAMLGVSILANQRLALPDEAIRPRRAFLAAFACFGAVRALAGKLPQIVNADQQLLEMSLAVMGVCACEDALVAECRTFDIVYHRDDGYLKFRRSDMVVDSQLKSITFPTV